MGVLTRWLPLVASCLVATACSMASLGYEFFPTWAHWQIDSYVSLDAEQKAIVQRRLSELHGWHRQSQLPGYVEFLKSTREQARAPLAPGQAADVRKKVQAAWNPIVDGLAPGMAEVMLTLKPAQIERIANQLAKENRKVREEFLPTARSGWFGRRSVAQEAEGAAADGLGARPSADPADTAAGRPERLDARHEARVERIRKRLEYFLGDLTDDQEKLLRQQTRDLPPTEELYLAERESRQQRFLALARRIQSEAPAVSEAERLCREYLAGLWVSADPTRRQRLEQAAQRSDQLTARLLATATADQQAFLVERLRKWERDLARMAGID